MAKISYEAFQKVSDEQTGGNGIGFFSLKNDGDEAIVRIMHDSPADYDILSVHPVKVGDRHTKVECIDDPVHGSTCPLCQSKVKLQYRFFVHMIQYVQDESGRISAKPVVWDRSAKEMATKLNTMLQEYGPLSDCIFKIRRNGKPNDMHTTYEIMFTNPNVYRADLYPKDDEVFKGYSASGKQVMLKTAEDMQVFLRTGNFPDSNDGGNTSDNNPQTQAPAPNVPWNHNGGAQPNFQGANPGGMASGRPARYY